ncbi:MAG: hypothetical protein HQ542_01640 [Bacteroidia bacterium]|nr:hypothetical protein [Bacteroidia bacterium]
MDAPKYAESLHAMAASLFQFLQEQGFDINQEQLGEMMDPGCPLRSAHYGSQYHAGTK